ncbi:unnamed protein product [Rhizoctonia solani]|uniref:Defective in cullin neddylation protein n=1 Tax=Rhizoctonia solani TaxID=456999 RepID=A0A8H3DGZ3_9AGAM|nr:unnamed protein product [Rhizoctonia solani]
MDYPSKDQAISILKKHNYRLDAAVDAYYQSLTDTPPAQVSTEKLGTLFNKYKDPDSPDIGISGTIQWCEDLGVDPEDVSLLAVACELKSPKVGEWTKNGFVDGWKRLGFTHFFLPTNLDSATAIENAIGFWTLLLNVGLSGPALPRNGWTDQYTEWWFEFLKERGGKGVSKDTWAMLPEFIKVIDEKFENHDLEAAWPSTIDDFVEWAKEKLQADHT